MKKTAAILVAVTMLASVTLAQPPLPGQNTQTQDTDQETGTEAPPMPGENTEKTNETPPMPGNKTGEKGNQTSENRNKSTFAQMIQNIAAIISILS